jgi:hypothetical protein
MLADDLFFQNLAFEGSLGIVRLDIFFLTESCNKKTRKLIILGGNAA